MTNNDTQQALEALSTLVGADDELGQYWLQIIRQALQSQAEKDRVIDHCDLMRDEFMRIKSCQNATEEIKNLCDRALKRTDRNVPVLSELEELSGLKKQLDAGLILQGKEGFSPDFYEIVEINQARRDTR